MKISIGNKEVCFKGDTNLSKEYLAALFVLTEGIEITGAELRSIRNILGLTITELAQKMNLNESVVNLNEELTNVPKGLCLAYEALVRRELFPVNLGESYLWV